MTEKRPQGRPRTPIVHGTDAGYAKHRRYGPPIDAEDSCGCRRANAEATRLRKAGQTPPSASPSSTRIPPPGQAMLPCRTNPDRQFPDGQGPGHAAQVEAAKHVCNSGAGGRPCPAKDACLSWALRHRVQGVWGATTEHERESIRKRHGIKAESLTLAGLGLRPPAPCGTPGRYRKHLRDGEHCQECVDGYARYQNPEGRSLRWRAS